MKAVIIAPAHRGEGGLGAAAGDMADGLASLGLGVEFVGRAPDSFVRRLGRHRPLRSFPSILRELDRRAVKRNVPPEWDLAYAVPGFLPGAVHGIRVLHHATRHPRQVRAAMADARARAGGGRGFMTRREAVRLERELESADVVRVESLAVRDDLLNAGVQPQRIVHAYPGVDLNRYRPATQSGPLQIAFVGPLALWKGLDIVKELSARLGADEVLGVVGGPVCRWSRSVAESMPHTRFTDVRTLLASSHALVLPSASDGFARVVLEAMASETLPFVSPEVGAAEIVKQIDPVLVQPRAAFAENVADLLRSLPLATLASRSRELAQEFDRTRMISAAAEKVATAASLPLPVQK